MLTTIKRVSHYIYKDNKLYASATDQDTAIKWFIKSKIKI